MKLVVFCLLAVTCCAWAETSADRTKQVNKLTEVIKELRKLKKGLQHNGSTLNTPSQNTENCCYVSVLSCFQKNVIHLNVTDKVLQKRLSRSLRNPLTVNGVNFCDSQNATQINCQSCDSYPKRDTSEFVEQMFSFIQEAITRRTDS